MTPVGGLSDVEWGWIVTAVLFGWIKIRAEQATEQRHRRRKQRSVGPPGSIRIRGTLGAIAAILPELADDRTSTGPSRWPSSRATR